jgi:glucose/arabinose dehydrogenase
MKTRLLLPIAAILLLGLPAGARSAALTTVRVASGLSRPIYAAAPAGDDRMFIIEQRGVIKILSGGTVLPTPFLDIDALIPDIAGNDERGLLGIAFHPDYAANGFFYLDYVDLSGNTVIARYHVSTDPNVADPASATILMTIAQPYTNHKGGTLLFGPRDGYLYIGMGDGGNAGDPGNRAQDPGVLLGKMLRIDVNGTPPYSIPPDNPFAGPDLPLDEIWDLGLRNPYRWTFDRLTGDMIIADVGQSSWEEVDFEPAGSGGGRNYGWRLMEGAHCFTPPNNCNDGSLVLPIFEYSHGGNPFRCSITGGSIYRGSALPGFQGTYFFADYCSNQIWSFRTDGQTVSEYTDRTTELAPGGGLSIVNIAAIVEDGHGELYIVDRGSGGDGEIYRIQLRASGAGDMPDDFRFDLGAFTPNPMRESGRIEVRMEEAGPLDLEVIDAAGRSVRTLAARHIETGVHSVVWDGRNAEGRPVPSGAYFLRAAAGPGRATRSILVLR